MPNYDRALSQSTRGRFLTALRCLGGRQSATGSRPTREQILIAEMLQYTGNNVAAEKVARRLAASRDTPTLVVARCHSVLGLVATARGKTHLASTAFQKAILIAEEAADAAEICRAQLNLLANVSDLFGPHSTTTLTRDVSRRVNSWRFRNSGG